MISVYIPITLTCDRSDAVILVLSIKLALQPYSPESETRAADTVSTDINY